MSEQIDNVEVDALTDSELEEVAGGLADSCAGCCSCSNCSNGGGGVVAEM